MWLTTGEALTPLLAQSKLACSRKSVIPRWSQENRSSGFSLANTVSLSPTWNTWNTVSKRIIIIWLCPGKLNICIWECLYQQYSYKPKTKNRLKSISNVSITSHGMFTCGVLCHHKTMAVTRTLNAQLQSTQDGAKRLLQCTVQIQTKWCCLGMNYASNWGWITRGKGKELVQKGVPGDPLGPSDFSL